VLEAPFSFYLLNVRNVFAVPAHRGRTIDLWLKKSEKSKMGEGVKPTILPHSQVPSHRRATQHHGSMSTVPDRTSVSMKGELIQNSKLFGRPDVCPDQIS